ncbi:MAG TPA: DUF1565 domain-containing protein, partial [Planctomycetota bacterium]|nr:DUF1565 domain-containing protein [Planctomycetota bacterium]
SRARAPAGATSAPPAGGAPGLDTMQRPSLLALAALGAATFSLPASGQDLLGKWDTITLPPGQTHIPVYASPNGLDTNSGLAPNDAKRSITGALTDPTISLLVGLPGLLVTINVAPGTYDAANGEVFPLTIPAHGLSLESWTEGLTGPLDRPVVAVGFSGPGIFVDRIGDNSLPPSVVQGLSITGGIPAIDVDPAPPPFEPKEPIRIGVELRDNVITSSPRGIRLNTQAYLASLYVVEDNDVGGPVPVALGGVGGVGIEEECQEGAAASTLYRSNRIQLYEVDLSIEGFGGAIDDRLPCAPRIFSNFLQLAEFTARITNCDTFLVNNTLAFAVNYSGNMLAEGLRVTGGSLEHHNNILWNPDNAGGAFFFPTMPVDELFTGVAFPNPPTTNLVTDNGDPAPDFVGGNALTGASVFPIDLHLSATSAAAIGAGTNLRTLDDSNLIPEVAQTVRSWEVPIPGTAPVATLVVRTDVNLDNDLEPRILNSGSPFEAGPLPLVDIGGDEFKVSVDIGDGLPPVIDGRIETVARDGSAPATQDEHGNVVQQPGTTFTWNADLFLQGPASGVFAMFGGFGFLDTLPDPVLPVPTQNGSLYQNLFFDGLGWGCFALSPDTAITLNLGAGAFDPTGLFTDPATGDPFWRIPFAFTTQPFEEAEIFVQMLVIDPAGRFAFSNRKPLELNVAP